MSRLFGEMRQVGIVVRDIEAAMKHWVEVCGIGPWFYTGKLAVTEFSYRGTRYDDIHVSIALANSGDVQLELIQQHDDAPSMYKEAAGFTASAVLSTQDFDAELARLHAEGFQTAFEDVLPTGARITYADTQPSLPGMLELVERTDDQLATYGRIHAASIDWDGDDPLRRD